MYAIGITPECDNIMTDVFSLLPPRLRRGSLRFRWLAEPKLQRSEGWRTERIRTSDLQFRNCSIFGVLVSTDISASHLPVDTISRF